MVCPFFHIRGFLYCTVVFRVLSVNGVNGITNLRGFFIFDCNIILIKLRERELGLDFGCLRPFLNVIATVKFIRSCTFRGKRLRKGLIMVHALHSFRRTPITMPIIRTINRFLLTARSIRSVIAESLHWPLIMPSSFQLKLPLMLIAMTVLYSHLIIISWLMMINCRSRRIIVLPGHRL